jgi:hypothetical protein
MFNALTPMTNADIIIWSGNNNGQGGNNGQNGSGNNNVNILEIWQLRLHPIYDQAVYGMHNAREIMAGRAPLANREARDLSLLPAPPQIGGQIGARPTRAG